MIRSHLSNHIYPKVSYIVLEKKDKAVQTDECLALKIGDQIVSGGFNQQSPECKGTAVSTTWWQSLLKWN